MFCNSCFLFAYKGTMYLSVNLTFEFYNKQIPIGITTKYIKMTALP